MGKIVTIFSDASHCNDTGAAGWAAWIKSDSGTYVRSNAFRKPARNAVEAEVGGVANAIAIAAVLHGTEKGTRFIIACDCMQAVDVVNHPGKHKFKWPSEIIAHLKKEVARLRNLGCTVEARHVKGHAGGLEPRSYINEKLDKMAKVEMKKKRKELQKCA